MDDSVSRKVIRWNEHDENVPVQPNQALGGSVLLLLELIQDEVLERF